MTANRGAQAIYYVSCASLLGFPTSPSYVGFALASLAFALPPRRSGGVDASSPHYHA